MTRLRFVIRESAKTIMRHPGVALGSLLSLSLIFLLFNIFWVTALSTNRFYADLLQQLKMEVFIAEAVSDSSLAALSTRIQGIDGIASLESISKDQARQELARMVGIDLLVGYDTLNPLPRSMVLTLKPEMLTVSDMQRIEQQISGSDGVEDVLYSRDWLVKAEHTRTVVSTVGWAIGLLILLTAVITSSNSIRLMTRARGLGFHQMILMGAGRFFVAAPFLLEGILLAGSSALLGWGVVWYAHSKFEFTQFPIVLPSGMLILYFCLAAAAVGGISGLLGIRKLLS
ncbi:MAG: hypothetical protein IPH75_13625 [bacterium]|nr:hypothetical protein [bacterium]